MKSFFKAILIALCGAVVGFVNGFLGAGGGILLVPVLEFICKIDIKKSHSTAVLIIFPICLVSAVLYCFKNGLTLNVMIPVGIGSIVGGVVGTFALKKINSEWLFFVFAIIMILAGVKMVI